MRATLGISRLALLHLPLHGHVHTTQNPRMGGEEGGARGVSSPLSHLACSAHGRCSIPLHPARPTPELGVLPSTARSMMAGQSSGADGHACRFGQGLGGFTRKQENPAMLPSFAAHGVPRPRTLHRAPVGQGPAGRSRVLVGWPLPLGLSLGGRLLLARRWRVCV